ncbi:MAG: hypothetical protein KAT69_04065, partial [Candidatus Aminicenantes bacterium]|nr:hypothetical protein [Candidatus Aminicenantes bacterium]
MRKYLSMVTLSRLFRKISVFFFLTFLTFQFASPETQAMRTVHLKIAADEEFKIKNSLTWRSEIKLLISSTSSDFEKLFGIRLKIETFDTWLSDNAQNSTLGLLMDLRQKVSQQNYDIVLGLTSQQGTRHDISGAAT